MKNSLLGLFLALVIGAILVSCGGNTPIESKVPDSTTLDPMLDEQSFTDASPESENDVETQENDVSETISENIYETSKDINAYYKEKFSTWEEFKKYFESYDIIDYLNYSIEVTNESEADLLKSCVLTDFHNKANNKKYLLGVRDFEESKILITFIPKNDNELIDFRGEFYPENETKDGTKRVVCYFDDVIISDTQNTVKKDEKISVSFDVPDIWLRETDERMSEAFVVLDRETQRYRKAFIYRTVYETPSDYVLGEDVYYVCNKWALLNPDTDKNIKPIKVGETATGCKYAAYEINLKYYCFIQLGKGYIIQVESEYYDSNYMDGIIDSVRVKF